MVYTRIVFILGFLPEICEILGALLDASASAWQVVMVEGVSGRVQASNFGIGVCVVVYIGTW
jgi:hypothetical protein